MRSSSSLAKLFGGSAIGIGLGAAAITAVVLVLLGASAPVPPSLDPSIAAALADQGIVVSAPTTSNPFISEDRAKAAAISESHDPAHTTVATATLVQVLVRPNPSMNCTCWVVLLVGPGAPLGGPPGVDRTALANRLKAYTRFYVGFVDAQSGRFEFSAESYIQPSSIASP